MIPGFDVSGTEAYAQLLIPPLLKHLNLMAKQQSSFPLPFDPEPYSAIELSIIKERLRQAQYSFNLAFMATAISACIGAGLLLSGKVPEGTVTTAGGLASGIRCMQLAKDANDRLDKALAELKDEGKDEE